MTRSGERILLTGVKLGLSIGLSALLAVTSLSCGGSAVKSANPHMAVGTQLAPGPGAPGGPLARVPSASPVAMTATPRSLLALCLGNNLLRPVCPRQVPLANEPHTIVRRLGACIDARGRDLMTNGNYAVLDSGRCAQQAIWGYEAIGWPPGMPFPGYATGWDPVTRTRATAESTLLPPPIHVHIEIAATPGPADQLGYQGAWPTGVHRITDTLLNPQRTHAVSLGWVRWYGRYGQLVLEPVYPSGGEWGGHLVFRFTAGRINYAITLHAWMPAVRLIGKHVNRLIQFEAGPALPHVIATLKTLLRSALHADAEQK